MNFKIHVFFPKYLYRALRDVFCFDILSGNAAWWSTFLNVQGERINKKLNNSSSLRPRAELVVAVYPFSPHKTKGASVVLETSHYELIPLPPSSQFVKKSDRYVICERLLGGVQLTAE